MFRNHLFLCILLTLILSIPACSNNVGISEKIVFTSERDGNQEIYVMDADGSNQQRLTNNLNNDFSSSFSPDGSLIIFVSDRDGNDEIYLMNCHKLAHQRYVLNNDTVFFCTIKSY